MDFSGPFITAMLPRIEWPVLLAVARQVLPAQRCDAQHTDMQLGKGDGLPEQVPDNAAEDEAFLRAAHHVLLEVCMHAAALICMQNMHS